MTIIAAYADPCRVLALMMIPALDHGSRPGCIPDAPGPAWTRPFDAVGSRPVSEVTRAVMLPFPASGRWTK